MNDNREKESKMERQLKIIRLSKYISRDIINFIEQTETEYTSNGTDPDEFRSALRLSFDTLANTLPDTQPINKGE